MGECEMLLLGYVWSAHEGWAWSKYLEEFLKEVITLFACLYRDITHMKSSFIHYWKDIVFSLFSPILDSLH